MRHPGEAAVDEEGHFAARFHANILRQRVERLVPVAAAARVV